MEALKDQKTLAELSVEYGVNQHQIRHWKTEFLRRAGEIFGKPEPDKELAREDEKLYTKIGKLAMKNDWLKKKTLAYTVSELRSMVEPKHPMFSIVDQCNILGISRSGNCYTPCPVNQETLKLMELIDQQYTKAPYYGTRKMAKHLNNRKPTATSILGVIFRVVNFARAEVCAAG